MSDYQKIKKYYDKYGETYHKERDNTYYYSFINEIEVGVIEQFGESKKTLEIGCGTGIILNEVSKFASEAWGMDLSTGMLEDARKQGLNVKEGNAAEIPFPDNEFDVVYSFKVLPHVPEIEQAVSEIARVLKPGGKAILEFYNPYSFKGITNRIARAPKKIFTMYHSPNEVKGLVSKHFDISNVVGARILTPAAVFHKLPFFERKLKQWEKKLSRSNLNKYAGYYIVILDKK